MIARRLTAHTLRLPALPALRQLAHLVHLSAGRPEHQLMLHGLELANVRLLLCVARERARGNERRKQAEKENDDRPSDGAIGRQRFLEPSR
jgi:hypothetical protein